MLEHPGDRDRASEFLKHTKIRVGDEKWRVNGLANGRNIHNLI